MASRQPFRNIKQSPREIGSEMNEKDLSTDNFRVLVKPATARGGTEKTAAYTNPTSSPRTIQSHRSGGSHTSPWGINSEDTDRDPKMTLHHSEISILQQLCLDKLDENAAIELLLDSTEKNTAEIYTQSSEGSDQDSVTLPKKQTGSVEGKRKFLNRLFSKPQRKSSVESFSSDDFFDSFKENDRPMSHSNMSDETTIPTPPSSTPRTRITVESNAFPRTPDTAWKAYSEGSIPKTPSDQLSSTTKKHQIVERSKSVERLRSTSGTHVEKSSSTTGNQIERSRSTTGTHEDRSRATTKNHVDRSRFTNETNAKSLISSTGKQFERSRSVQRSRSATKNQIERSRSTTGTHFEKSRSANRSYFETSKSAGGNNFERSTSMFEGADTISRLTSFSGTRASSLLTPVNFDRNESLGFESIRDIRKCLKEMERQLGRATDKGQRVSRDKLVRALFIVADSLEDDEDKSYLKKELETSMETRNDEVLEKPSRKPLKRNLGHDSKSEGTSSDEEDLTLDSESDSGGSDTFDRDDEDDESNESPFNIVSSVGNFLGVKSEEQQAVEEVLDDLLWTEFVSQRQKNAEKKKRNSANSRSKHHSGKGKTRSERNRRSSVETKKYKEPHAKKERSWWRKHPLKDEDEEVYSTSSSDDDECSTSSSSTDEFKSYLPTSITVKKRSKKPAKLEDSFPRSVSNPHYKVKLVDTESRLGYEMDHAPRRSPVM